jgi:hypothetical protein
MSPHYSLQHQLTLLIAGVLQTGLFFVAASNNFAACSFGWWLMAGADLFSEKRTAGWFVQREKYC